MIDDQDDNSIQDAMRHLPSVDALLNQPAIASLLDEFARPELLLCIRTVLEQRRAALLAGDSPGLDTPALSLDVRQMLYQRIQPNLRRVINATGVVLHTNLGRAPLAEEAIEAVNAVAAGYSNLEYDLSAGKRGSRYDHLRDLIRELTGAEDALVVNNNAAGTFLVLHALASGRPAIVSRGQLVEIGGSYRMPDIMAEAGCKMIEVGTTNRTHIADYERAIDEDTAVLLRVHTSNYRIEGFTTTPMLEELATLARKYERQNIAVVDDLGSGLMYRTRPSADDAEDGAPSIGSDWDEPTVRHSIEAGADVTLFSGDKLLGGPQAGVIVGRADLIKRVRQNPMARTFRPDKMTLAGLEATLRLYRDPAAPARRLPVHRMLAAPPARLRENAERLAENIAALLPEAEIAAEQDESYAGGGTLPALPFDTWVTSVSLPDHAPNRLASALRSQALPVICRISDEALIFDTRTLFPDDMDQIPAILAETLRELEGE